MKKRAEFFIVVSVLLFAASCAGVPEGEEAAQPQVGTAPAEDTEQESEVKEPKEGFKRPYDKQLFESTLVQFHELIMSRDYFGQYTYGDTLFEDYLMLIFGIESGPYLEGKGTVLALYDESGAVREKITRIYLGEEGADGGPQGWWRVEHEREGESVVYELHTDKYSVVDELRFILPDTGEVYRRETLFSESVKEAEESMSGDEIRAALDAERAEKLKEKLPLIYGSVEKAGEETIEVAGEELYAARYEGRYEEGGMDIVVHISPDIPGGLMRLRAADRIVAEIVSFVDGAEREYSDDRTKDYPAQFADMGAMGQSSMGQATGPFESEGTIESPVELSVSVPYEGSVGPGATSYYVLEVPYRCDVEVRAEGHMGAAEFFSFGEDSTFREWRSSSQGNPMRLQHYFAEEGIRLYYSIEDIAGDGQEGESYYLTVEANPLLEQLGVRMRGSYREQAILLKRGGTDIGYLEPGELLYYAVDVEAGETLELTVTNLEEGLQEFRFIDVLGAFYGSAGSYSTAAGERRIEIGGIDGEGRAYFFAVAAPEGEERMIQIRTEVK